MGRPQAFELLAQILDAPARVLIQPVRIGVHDHHFIAVEHAEVNT